MRYPPFLLLAFIPIVLALPLLPGCGCGFDCNDDDDNDGQPATITIGLSDSQPEDLKEVVIVIDSIVLRRDDPGKEDVVIDTFTVPDLDADEDATLPVNLLNYIGVAQVLVVKDQELEADFYDAIDINVVLGDQNSSYVVNQLDEQKILSVTNGTLNLPGRQIQSGENAITIEFELARALQFKAANDTYLLTTEGVRVVDPTLATQVLGSIDSSLFDTVSQCDEKADPLDGNRVYIYEGTGLDPENLADVFSEDSDASAGKLAPYSVASLFNNEPAQTWDYYFGYLPSGDYTIAFSCNTEDDDSVTYDALDVPLPSDQIYEISLSTSEQKRCDLVEEPSLEICSE